MNIYDDGLFKIYYNACDKRYLNQLISILSQRIPSILEFFKLNNNKKIIIKLYDNLEFYKNNLICSFEKEAENESKKQGKKIFPRKYQNWMIANTEDGNINMQSLDLVRMQDDYKDYTILEFCYDACHEFTHICQQRINSNSPGWFWEVLATYLGNPECQHEIKNDFSLNDLYENFDSIDGYGAAFKIGKYLFENYDNDFILSLVNDNNKLKVLMNEIIDNLNSNNIMQKNHI